MLSIGHGLLDDRIYFKEVQSLVKEFSPFVVIATGQHQGPVHGPCSGVIFRSLGNEAFSILSRLKMLGQAFKAILAIKPTVCHIHDYELIFILPLIKLFCDAKIIYDVHEVNPEKFLHSNKVPKLLKVPGAALVWLTERIFSLFADAILTAVEPIREQFELAHSNVTTIFNYPRLELFKPDDNFLALLKQEFKGRTVLICHGSFSEQRGLYTMIDAMKYVKEIRPEVVLLVVGKMDIVTQRRAEEQIAFLDLDDHIILTGWIPHQLVVNYIHLARLGLVPMLSCKKHLKSIPVKQLEYMVCGIPVVGSDLPPVSAYVGKAGAGLLFLPGDAEDMAKSILEALANEKRWQQMSEAGLRAIREEWNWDKMEPKLLQVYRILTKSAQEERVEN